MSDGFSVMDSSIMSTPYIGGYGKSAREMDNLNYHSIVVNAARHSNYAAVELAIQRAAFMGDSIPLFVLKEALAASERNRESSLQIGSPDLCRTLLKGHIAQASNRQQERNEA